MTNSPDSTNEINQSFTDNKGQAIGQMMGGIAVGQLTVYLSQKPTEETTQATTPDEIGENPYQGLKAFRETDGDRFFGRDLQIQKLWEEFQKLHGDRSTIRVLPIYGPSGSGKSSLARAGLIPAIGKQPLPTKDKARVLVFTPGYKPFEVLAAMVARVVEGKETLIQKRRDCEKEFEARNQEKKFDGLQRIVDLCENIDSSPLIILVDQFEELYTLCKDEQVRHAFVENLLYVASDPSQKVSVIITMRSDFLGKTQQHPHLNALFSSQGFLVPIMQPEELEVAITEPAKQAGYGLDKAVVELLIKESQGQDGALPLLQFALTQIWEGLRDGIQPIETFKKIGGVGGALANEAKRIYYDLTLEQQVIARSIFLALIQLNDDNKSTRRRAAISELISSQQNETLVRQVIDRFARPGVWILVTFSSDQQVEMLEVAHEALIQNWQELKDWLKEHREALSKKRKIEQFADEWKTNKKSKDYLLQGRILRDAQEFLKAQKDNTETSLSGLAKTFIKGSKKKQKIHTLKTISFLLVFPFIIALTIFHNLQINRAKKVLMDKNCIPDPNARNVLEYMWKTGYKLKLQGINLCEENLSGINLEGADISNSNLQKVHLDFANLKNSFFVNSDFRNAFMVGTDLTGSVLRNAKMENVDLRGAIIRDVSLVGVQFRGVDLTRADLTDANLEQANFIDTKGLSIDQIRQARTICNAKFPDTIQELYAEEIKIKRHNCTGTE